jgi:hypothetical protein
MEGLMQLVMTMHERAYEEVDSGYDLPQGELWRHSAGFAAADLLVSTISDAGEVFTAALPTTSATYSGRLREEDLGTNGWWPKALCLVAEYIVLDQSCRHRRKNFAKNGRCPRSWSMRSVGTTIRKTATNTVARRRGACGHAWGAGSLRKGRTIQSLNRRWRPALDVNQSHIDKPAE